MNKQDIYCILFFFFFLQTKIGLQLYQVDQKSYLLDFKSLAPLDFEESTALSPTPSSLAQEQQQQCPEPGSCHYVMEFFEMCSELIVALAC